MSRPQGNPFFPQPVGEKLTGPRSARTKNTTPLVEMLPNFITKRAWFTEIPTASSTLTVAAGMSAWFGLRRLRRSELGENMGLFGVRAELLPTNNTATLVAPSAGTAATWGDTAGNKAAIVVGVNLPNLAVGEWTQAPCYAPGVEFGVAGAQGLLSGADELPYLYTRAFPPGSLNGSAPQRHVDPVSWAPWVYPIREADSLDVALVVNRSQFNTAQASDLVIVGFGAVTLFLGRTFAKVGDG